MKLSLKPLLAFMAVLLVLQLASGCAPRQPGESSQTSQDPAPSQSSSEPEQKQEGYDLTGLALLPPAPGDSSAELAHGGYEAQNVRLCLWLPEQQVYQTIGLPVPSEGVTSLSVVQTVAKALNISLPVNTIARHKQMLVLDLPASLVQGELADPLQEEIILNSVGMSLIVNGNDVGFTLDGGQYKTAGLTLENDGYGYYQPPELKLAVIPGEYDAIRASIPYPGLDTRGFVIPDYVMTLDDTAKALADYLVMVGEPEKDFAAPAEIDPKQVLRQAITASYLLQEYEHNPEYEPAFIYQPQIFPIAVAVRDRELLLGEHVEQSAKLIFGEDIKVQHQDWFKYRWHPVEGVYTPPHMGGGGPIVPVILGYEDKGDRYEVELVYLRYGLDAFFVEDDMVTDNAKLQEYAKTKAQRYNAVVLKKDGGLQIQSIQKQ